MGKLVQFLSKTLNIYPGEWSRLLILYAILFTYMVGWIWGASIVEAAFLNNLGFEALPLFFIVKGAISIPAVMLYSIFADRAARDRLMLIILGSSALSIGVALLLLGGGVVALAFPLLYLTLLILDDIFATHWYTYTGEFLDTRSAKRLIPVITSAAVLGSVVAGLSMPLLSSLVPPAVIVGGWLVALFIMMAIIWTVAETRRKAQAQHSDSPLLNMPSDTADDPTESQSYIQDIKEGATYVQQSPLLRWLAIASLLVIVLLVLLEYVTSRFLLSQLQTTEAIASFTGPVIALSSMLVFPFQLFFLSRIIGRIGVANANMIYPVGNLAISGAFVGVPTLPTAALAYFNRNSFFPISFMISNLLYNAVPTRVQGRARAFTGGLLLPVGSIVGGVLLLLVQTSGLLWMAPAMLLLVSVAYLVSNWFIRKHYTSTLIATLEEEDFSFQLAQGASDLQVVDPTVLSVLKKRLDESASERFTVFMARLISQVPGNEPVAILCDTIRTAQSATVRSAVIDILISTDVRSHEVHSFLLGYLHDPAANVRLSALVGLQELFGRADPALQQQASTMLEDPAIEVRTEALLIVLSSPQAERWQLAVNHIDTLLASENPAWRARAVEVLGKSQDDQHMHKLIPYLTDTSDDVRLKAAVAFENVLRNTLPGELMHLVLTQMSDRVSDPVERVRLAALLVLGYIGNADSLPIFVQSLTDSSSQIRTSSVDMLVRIGTKGALEIEALNIPIDRWKDSEILRKLKRPGDQSELGKVVVSDLVPYLKAENIQLRKMVAVVLSRINRERFGSLIISAVNDNLLTIYRNQGRWKALQPYADFPSIGVVQSALREQNQLLMDEIFYLLAATNEARSVKVVTEALRSNAPHVQANAMEALEGMTTPHIARLIEPLLGTADASSTMQTLGRETWGLHVPDTATAVRELSRDQDMPWYRSMIVFALGEIGAVNWPRTAPVSAPADDAVLDLERLDEPVAPRNRPNRMGRKAASDALLGRLLPADGHSEQGTAAAPHAAPESAAGTGSGLSLALIEQIITEALNDADADVRSAARAAQRQLAGKAVTDDESPRTARLSKVERVMFLKGVSFFQGMKIDQLQALAAVCEEQHFPADTAIFEPGDAGLTLYVVVSGQVVLEQEKRGRKFAHLATIEARSPFGEASMFDGTPHTTRATARRDTLTLALAREPLLALARQNPDVSFEIINVLSQRLREANERIAELTRSQPRELHKLYDQFD